MFSSVTKRFINVTKWFQNVTKTLHNRYCFYLILRERVDIFLEKLFLKTKNNGIYLLEVLFLGGPFLDIFVRLYIMKL